MRTSPMRLSRRRVRRRATERGERVRCRPATSAHHDAGFATVWVVTAMALVAAAAAVALCYGAAIVQRHRAGAAADAVALVVALRAIDGQPAACRAGALL